MPYRIPPTHCLTAFEAVARLRSTVQAAEELCVTPSAVSHRIRQLEETLGTKLFQRTAGEFSLTVEGHAYLGAVREALNRLGQFPMARERIERRPLRLAVTPTFARQILMSRLPAFQTAYPDIELVLQVSIPLLDVTAEDADLEVRYGTGPYPGLETLRLLDDRVSPACSPEYLRAHGPFDTPERLSRGALLRSPLEPWRTWFSAFGVDSPESPGAPAALQFNDLGLMYDAAANGQGIALARLVLGKEWIETGQLVRLSERALPSPYSHFLVYRQALLERYECARFIEWLRGEMAALAG